MIGNYFARLTGSKRNLLALLASSAVFTAGCANMSTTALDSNPFSSPATLSGTIHGGNQPVIGATVTLWFAGQSTAAVAAATTTTGSGGAFSFTKAANDLPNSGTTNTYSCPTSGAGADPLVYVVAKGGNTQNNGVPGQTNTAAAFIALYPGTCTQLTATNFVYMSEVTSAATMAAIGQFFNPVDGTISADGTGQQKIITSNISKTIALLADPTTGLGVASTTISSGANITPAVSVTATPEAGKINLIANIISSCINGATATNASCTSLFSAAAAPQGNTTIPNTSLPAATDTLQALYYMFSNPGSGSVAHMTTLFGLSPAVGAPYQPSLATQPTDWSVGISYQSSSNCATNAYINGPIDVGVDASDNVWFANSVGGNLSGISSAGVPVACVHLDAGTSSGGGVLDSAANVWYGAGTTMYRYNPATKTSLAFPAGVSPLGITADGAGNVYFTAVAGTTGSLYIIPGAASAAAAVTPVQISSTVGPAPKRLMADNRWTLATVSPGNVWVVSGSTFVSQVSKSTAAGNLNGWITTPFTTSGNSSGVSLDSNSDVFVSALDTGAITLLSRSGTVWTPASSWPFTAAASAGISAPTGISVDGRASTWIPNSAQSSLSKISFFGPNALSPATGLQKAPSYLNVNSALAIDQAGNIWVVGSTNGFITEIVGGAVPLYQPYAVGNAVNRFQTIP